MVDDEKKKSFASIDAAEEAFGQRGIGVIIPSSCCRRLQQANGTSAFAHVFVPVRFRRQTSFHCSYTTIFILDNNFTLLQAVPTLLKAVRHQGRAINRGSLSGYGAVMNDLQLSPR
jgi:hypothetical protein